MTDRLLPERRSENMRRIKSTNTKIEVLFRRALCAVGVRGYRVHAKNVKGKPDVVFVGKKVAVFVDGCFWHGCDKCYVAPSSNRSYWSTKLEGNKRRDKRVTEQLVGEGWIVLRVWEHEVEHAMDSCVRSVRRAIRGR